MDYYSLDEILEEEEMVDTRFTVGGHKLGYLDAKRKRPSDDVSRRISVSSHAMNCIALI